MATGCFISTGRSLDDAVARVRLAEELGYEAVYVTHINGRESLTVLTAFEVGLRDRSQRGRGGPRVAIASKAVAHAGLVAHRCERREEVIGDRRLHGRRVAARGVVGLDVGAEARALEHRAVEGQPEVRAGAPGAG